MRPVSPDPGFAWVSRPWGAVLECAPLAAAARHFFTAGDLTLRDRPEEWKAVAAAAGVGEADLLLVRQVHGAAIAFAPVDRAASWPTPDADAIVGDDPGAAIGVRVADCVPILMAEEMGRVVAAVHAGWRGIAARVVIAAVEALQRRYGVRPARLIAALGPSIGPCCYEVGESTREAFAAAGHPARLLDEWFAPRSAGKYHLDQWRAVRDQLEGAGVPPARIHTAGLCTKTHAGTFHSYRVDGDRAGRMVAVIRAGGP